jgi:hypothetical protein
LAIATLLGPEAARAGSALQFDGSDDHVRVPHHTTLGFPDAATATFELWVYPPAFGGWHLLGKRGTCFDAGQSANYQLYLQIPGGIEFNSGSCKTNGGGIASGQWSHLAVVTDAAGTSILVNGVVFGQSSCTLSGGNSAGLWIGASTACPAPFRGRGSVRATPVRPIFRHRAPACQWCRWPSQRPSRRPWHPPSAAG